MDMAAMTMESKTTEREEHRWEKLRRANERAKSSSIVKFRVILFLEWCGVG